MLKCRGRVERFGTSALRLPDDNVPLWVTGRTASGIASRGGLSSHARRKQAGLVEHAHTRPSYRPST
jgi:hypothetical protein